jgi:DinB family protein
MNAQQQLIDSGLRAWQFNADRVESFFVALSEEQLQQEIAPGRNRLIYLWGHLAAVNDALFPLLGIGPKLYPELDAMFLANPDRHASSVLSGAELKSVWGRINQTLWTAFNKWSAADWLAKHTAVSDEDFVKEPHRNRYSVMLARNTHMAFHYGQAILAKPRA